MRKRIFNSSIVAGIFVCVLFNIGAANSDSHLHGSDNEDSLDNMLNVEYNLRLNEGKKWKMDQHTKTIFSKMAKGVLGTDMSLKSSEDLKSIGTGLAQDIQTLINGCTMTGFAHDELHKFLAGYIAAVYDLKEYGAIKSAETVRKYLEIYTQYFE